ncbi:MAG: hypothetical protein MJ248_04795 [Bacilli bacterium]|nr:hypothetical protein [Bacilli bacterium]
MEVIKAYQLLDNEIKELKLNPSFVSNREWGLLNIYDLEKTYFSSFGGAITNSSAFNYSLLNKEEKQKVLDMLVGKDGLRYSRFRLCIGSSDFSTESYSYVDENDESLESFSITKDRQIIEFTKDIIKNAYFKPRFFASCWSMPAFMKTNNDRLHGGKLKLEYYELYAEYIYKFLKAYKDEGIDIDAITIQNEPKATQTWESCVFEAEDEANFAKVLTKVLAKHNLKIDLYCWDHNKERLFERVDETVSISPGLFKGAAFHWYSGNHFDAIEALRKKHPDLEILETEFCVAYNFDRTKFSYSCEILNDIRCGTNSIVEWNVLLNEDGGPFHDRGNYKNGGCEAPVKLNTKTLKVEKGPTYNETYMFSRFIDNDAKILYTSTYDENVKVSAVKNPNGEIVVNILNSLDEQDTCIYYKKEHLQVVLPKGSLTTIIIK